VNDDQFLTAFESATLPAGEFHHRDHLRMAWLYVRRDGRERGVEAAANSLRRFAAAKGVPQLYHETLTHFWVRLMGHVAAATPDHIQDFEACLAHYHWLADKSLPYRHYRRETLDSAEARRAWAEPDLLPMPA